MKEMVGKDLINCLVKFNDELTKIRPNNRILIEQIGRKYIQLYEHEKFTSIRPICYVCKRTGLIYRMKSKYQAETSPIGDVQHPCKLVALKKDLK